jgi:4-amino-4-deoxy-L-arabinose transferase-like glycosyltransferase
MSAIAAHPAPGALDDARVDLPARQVDPPPPRSRHFHRWALLALTLFAAALRFGFPDRPGLWIDEAFTFWRVSGSYQELLDILQSDGFMPLHYEAAWLLGRVTSLDPFWLRFIPALCGTLMVPGMYFLARQLAGRHVALLTAAFTACSAYMLNYSRDAKMYMPLWLFATLHVACLLWWLRERSLVAWLAWVAAGLAMAGTHAPGLILLGIEPVFVLTARRVKWHTAVLWLAGVAVISAGPGGYYLTFNQFHERIEQQGWNRASGLNWVDWVNAGRTGYDNLRFPVTAYLINWEWPKRNGENDIPAWVLDTYKPALAAIGIVLVMGLFPWPRVARHAGGRGDGDDDVVPRRRSGGHGHAGPSPEPWWRSALWVSAWLIVPLYLFHSTSSKRLASPMDWLDPLLNAVGSGAAAIITAVVALAAFHYAGTTIPQRLRKTGQLLLVAGGVFGLCYLMSRHLDVRNKGSLWVTRYMAVVWPALAIAACALLLRLPGWPLRAAAIALLLGVNLVNGLARFVVRTEAPLARMAADVVAAQNVNGPRRTLVSPVNGGIFSGTILEPAGRYYLSQAAGMRVRPREFLVDNFNFRADEFLAASKIRIQSGGSPAQLRALAEADPHVRQIVVWQRSTAPPTRGETDELMELLRAPPPRGGGAGDGDATLAALGAGWQRASDEVFPVYSNFTWAFRHRWTRREYVRVAPVAATTTRPSSADDAFAR